ncbi:MAG: superoxide dismutase [Acidobacteriota bacterium]|nr:superoxide dismutase [Acidobacteriota bacterium]
MANGPITLPELPWADNALDPVISANTISYHYGKHHNAYVTKLNGMIEGTDMADMDLVSIIKKSAADGSAGIFNNAAQVWNHTFYWHSMKPGGGGAPSGKLADMINDSFGSYDAFRTQFGNTAKGQFGSGWAWLVKNGDKLEVVGTPNAETPITGDSTPLLTIDVWEHAYYLDHQNARPTYVDAVIDKLLNWDFAEQNLG